ncbi:MAG: hypothetical protein AAB393_02360, partial [Bacteroidota bacterium]
MRTHWHNLLLVLCAVALSLPSQAQYKDAGLGGGIGFGGTFGQTQLQDREGRFLARAFLRYPLVSRLQGETGVSIGRVAGSEYSTLIIPIDYRFVLSPFSFDNWNPYIYAGAGALHYEVEVAPPNAAPDAQLKGWTGVIPAGLGFQFRVDDR